MHLTYSDSVRRIFRLCIQAAAIGLSCLAWPAAVGGSASDGAPLSPTEAAGQVGGKVSGPSENSPNEQPGWPESLGAAWRLEFLRQHLTAPLFQSSEPLEAGPAEAAASTSASGEPERPSCEQLRRQGDRFLAQGLLPEAMTRYRSSEAVGCPDAEALQVQIGLLKVNLAMSRFEEAGAIAHRIEGKADPDTQPVLELLSGVLAAASGDYGRARDLFNRWRPYWPQIPAIQVLAAYSCLCQGNADEAVPLFRACEDSPFRPVRDFASLGLAQALLAGGRSDEAGPLYERLAAGGSPAGLLGRAEYRIRMGSLAQARQDLESLISGSANDYWKGVAYTYLLYLFLEQREWRPALACAEKGRMLILGESWNRRLLEGALRGLEQAVEDLGSSASPAAVWLLAQEWKSYLPSLKAETRLRLARSYQELGLRHAALDLYRENAGDPEAWLEAAKLAWQDEDLETASTFCEKVLALPDAPPKNEAKWLLGCLRFRQGEEEQARTLLVEAGSCQDPRLLAEGARAALAMGMIDWGIERLEKALASEAFDPEERAQAVQTLAEARYQRKQCEKVFENLDQVPSDSPQSLSPAPWKALCLLRSGKTAEARRVAEQLPVGPDRTWIEEILRADETIAAMESHPDGP